LLLQVTITDIKLICNNIFVELNYDDRIECIRLLFSLLATANCDTVLVLLKFLQDVASRSMDEYDDAGQLVSIDMSVTSC
jgi:hypothetical protein